MDTDLRADEVVRLYTRDGLSSQKIGEQMQMSKLTVTNLLRMRGVPVRPRGSRYVLDDDFFASVDTPEKMWVLGWFYSDGYNNEETGDVRITLNERDEEVLLKIRAVMGSNKPLHMARKYHQAILNLGRKKLSADLAALGCVQKKSLIIQYPHHLLDTRVKTCAFLRGILEGDGCINISKDKRPRVVVTIACASPDFVNSLREVFLANWDLHGSLDIRKGSVVAVKFAGNQLKIISMLDEIYDLKSCPHYLERKYQKYLEAVCAVKNCPPTRIYPHRSLLKLATTPGVYTCDALPSTSLPHTPDPVFIT